MSNITTKCDYGLSVKDVYNSPFFLYCCKTGVDVMEKRASWLGEIPARVNEDGYLQLSPENSEPTKSVIDVAPALNEAIEYEVVSGFPGVLS